MRKNGIAPIYISDNSPNDDLRNICSQLDGVVTKRLRLVKTAVVGTIPYEIPLDYFRTFYNDIIVSYMRDYKITKIHINSNS